MNDGALDSNVATVSITVNAAPTITALSDQTNDEADTISVSLTAADADGPAPIAWAAANLPAGLTINASTGQITGTIAHEIGHGMNLDSENPGQPDPAHWNPETSPFAQYAPPYVMSPILGVDTHLTKTDAEKLDSSP